MKTGEFPTVHVVMSSLGIIIGTGVVFIIGIWIYCMKRRNNDVIALSPPQQELHLEPIRHYYDITNQRNQAQHNVIAPPPPQQELHLEPIRHYYDITNQRNQAQHNVIAPPPPQQGLYLEPIHHDNEDGYATLK
ncbi:uncharacterized protein LOC144749980 [Ciona intestinalis]